MSSLRSLRLLVSVLCVIALLGACGSDGSDQQESQVPTTTPTPADSAAPPTTSTATTNAAPATTAGPEEDPPSLAELRSDLDIDVVVLEPASEGGNHPTLGWQATEGAASYWLVMRDGDGRPYWAWTGTDTSVRVGGGDSPETNQTAALHETMTWRVAAFDEQGNLVGLSDTATVSP